ncbi:MAG: (2Fe-2S)-binding protein [Deltaproteobacteria bacterium]|nr:(2Fe-2S)-binding protein [Deltaproteobacteria bacterium]
MQPDEKIMARLKPGCICKGIKLIRLLDAIDQGAESFEEVAKITGIGEGDCGGKRCRAKVEELLAVRKPV